MTKPIKPPKSEYREALDAYNLSAALWLGLDPRKVFKLDVDDKYAHGSPNFGAPEIRIWWEATEQQEPRVGHSTCGMWGDGETVGFTGETVVTHPEASAFVAEVGEKPRLLTRAQELMLKGLAAEAAERDAQQ